MAGMSPLAAAGAPHPQGSARLRLDPPGEWRRVELLASAAAVRRDCGAVAQALAAVATGPEASAVEADALRGRIRAELLRSTRLLRGGGATELQVGLRLDPETPLPCVLITFEPFRMDTGDPLGGDPATVIDDLERATAIVNALDADDDRVLRRVRALGATALRQHRIRRAPGSLIDAGTGAVDLVPSTPRLLTQYWIPIPGTRELIDVFFDTPLVDIADEMLGLFDRIIATARLEPGVRRPSTAAG